MLNSFGLRRYGFSTFGLGRREEELLSSGSSRRHRGRRQRLPDWIRQEDEEIVELIVHVVLSGALDG